MTGTPNNKTTPDFHGAAIVDDNGAETPITEEMIARACRELEAGQVSHGQWQSAAPVID